MTNLEGIAVCINFVWMGFAIGALWGKCKRYEQQIKELETLTMRVR